MDAALSACEICGEHALRILCDARQLAAHAQRLERFHAMRLRIAEIADVPALQELIARSARALSAGYYTADQAEAAIVYVFGVDSQLLADRIKQARQKGYEGDPCSSCGQLTLVRSGACAKCDTCGETSGCS